MSTQTNMLDASMRPDHTETREVGKVAAKRVALSPKQQREMVQKSADAYIELAQILEQAAKDYRQRAKHYRSGELMIGYSNLPADAGDHMRHPAQRAIDSMSEWTIKEHFERLRAELQAAK